MPTSSTPIPLSSGGTSSSQTITPIDLAAGASFDPSSQSVTVPGGTPGTVPAAMVAVSQSLGTLTITSNDAQFMVTGGNAETGLLGSAPTTKGDSIMGSAAAHLTITAGSNDTLHLTVNGTAVTVTLKPGKYTADALATEVQTEINKAITSTIPSVTSAITFASPHGLSTGQNVVYHSNGAMTVTQDNGTLTLDSNGPAIQVSGNAAMSLFGSSPQTSNSGTTITGSSAANLTIDSSDDTLILTASGTPFTITLTHGTYTAAALAGLLQQAINDVPALKAIYDVGGLTDGATYYVIKVNDDTIQLGIFAGQRHRRHRPHSRLEPGLRHGAEFHSDRARFGPHLRFLRRGDHTRRGRRDQLCQQPRPGHRRCRRSMRTAAAPASAA